MLPSWWCRGFIDFIPELARMFSYLIEPVIIHEVTLFSFNEKFSSRHPFLQQPIASKPEFYVWKIRMFEWLVVRVGERIDERLIIFAEKFVRSN